MGIHADAVAMAALTGKSVLECKKARKVHDAKIATLVKAGKKTPENMARACFGDVAVAVGKATKQPAKPAEKPVVPKASELPAEKQVQDPAPASQVEDAPAVEKQVETIETHDEDTITVENDAKSVSGKITESPEWLKSSKKKTSKKKKASKAPRKPRSKDDA